MAKWGLWKIKDLRPRGINVYGVFRWPPGADAPLLGWQAVGGPWWGLLVRSLYIPIVTSEVDSRETKDCVLVEFMHD